MLYLCHLFCNLGGIGMSELIFRCFASGSSGNCYYLGTRQQGVLIDAGISARTIRNHLRDMGLEFPNIMGVLVTHDHADHIRAVGTLGERFHIPIYGTANIHAGIDRNYGVREKLRTCRHYFELGVPFQLAGMTINTFTISHDSTECVGYVIDAFGQRFVMATDVGKVDDVLGQAIATANHLVIEANYDEYMLLNGPYPSYLKSRIISETGHMNNVDCGKLLAKNYHEGLRNIYLCHLSHENNTQEVAYGTVSDYLTDVDVIPGTHVNLVALERTTPSPVYQLIIDNDMERLVIIPTYNEKENIENIINAVMALPLEFHVLVIDDGSPDGTANIVKEMQKTLPDKLFLVERSGKLGLGTAYIAGFKWAIEHKYDYIFEMDADFSHNPEDLLKLYDACATQGADLSIGSRYITGVNVVNWPMGRVLMSYCASMYVRTVLGVDIRDTTAGFVCYRRQVLETMELDKIRFKGYAFQIEMKFTAYKCGFKIKEVPIIFINRVLGTSKMSGGIFSEALLGVVRLKLESWTRKYPKKV